MIKVAIVAPAVMIPGGKGVGGLQGTAAFSHKAKKIPSTADKVSISLICGGPFNHFLVYMVSVSVPRKTWFATKRHANGLSLNCKISPV